jgi:uncharacterized protein YidB (DUF937 family)
MGLLDNLESMAMNRVASSNPAASEILAMIQNHPGGINGLVQAFHQNGLGGLVNSWTSTGANQPATAVQMQQVLGPERVQAMAQKLGISPEAAGSTLAQLLPTVMDKLTPNGTIPDQSSLLQMGESLLASLGKTGSS